MKITPEVQQIFTLTTRLENDARNASSAQTEALALMEKVKARPQSASNDALLLRLGDLVAAEAPAAGAGRGRGGRGGAAATGPPALANIGAQLVAAAMSMQGSEMPPTAAQLEACAIQEAAYSSLMAKWSALRASVNGPAAAKPAAPKR